MGEQCFLEIHKKCYTKIKKRWNKFTFYIYTEVNKAHKRKYQKNLYVKKKVN